MKREKQTTSLNKLIIKVKEGERIQKNIGRIFRKYNIIEYKEPGETLTINDFYKGYGDGWLAPVQVELMPIADRHNEFTSKVAAELKKRGIRVEVDGRSEKIGFKIREAQLQKIPYMLVIGDKEVETENVSIRCRKRGDIGTMSVSDFCDMVEKEIREKTIITD